MANELQQVAQKVAATSDGRKLIELLQSELDVLKNNLITLENPDQVRRVQGEARATLRILMYFTK